MKDEIKEILGEIYNIQVRYSKPILKKNYSDKDYIIESYENLVFKMENCITNLQEENRKLRQRIMMYNSYYGVNPQGSDK